MFLDKKPFIYVWRPFYWLVFEMIIHPIALRLWTYFLLLPLPPAPPAHSMGARLREIERLRETLDRIEAALAEAKQERLAAEKLVLGRIDAALAESKQEWLATEKLMLALMQESGTDRAGQAR